MHHLDLETIENTKGIYHVYWSTGEKNKGVIEVPSEDTDGKLIAELVALRHLLTVEKVLGDRFNGNKVNIKASNGQIKKLLLNSSKKTSLMKFVNYFLITMKGVSIEVPKKRSQFLPEKNSPADQSLNVEDYACPNHLIESDKFGVLEISLHALDQFTERHPHGEMNQPWKSLYNQIQSDTLLMAKLPEKVATHKAKKHGEVAEIWKQDTSMVHFLMINRPNQDGKILVTVASRNEPMFHHYPE